MEKKWSLGITIGAALSGGFGRAVGGARDQVNALGRTIKSLSAQRGLVERMEKDQAAVEQARLKFEQAQKEVNRLKLAMSKGPPTKALSEEFENAKQKAEKLSAKLDQQRGKLTASQAAMVKAGIAVKDYATQYTKLGTEIDKARAKQERLQRIAGRKDAAGQRLGDMKGEMVGVAGAVYGGARLVGQEMDAEYEMRLFGNVANLTNRQLAGVRQQLKGISADTRQKPGALLEALNTLTAKGLDVGRSVASLSAIGKTATATGADINDLAGTAFTLIDAMGLSPDELPKALDMLAQAGKEGSFELKDMAQYFPMLTAQAKSLGLVGKEGVATLGAALQVAMKGASDPSEAANNFKNFLSKLTSPETVKKFDKLGVDIEGRMKAAMAAGKNPVEEMVLLIQQLTGGDKFRIGELFGDMQVIAFLDPMLQNLEKFRRIKDESLAAKGVVDQDFARMAETSKVQTEAFTNAVGRLGSAFAVTLLPAVNAVLRPGAALAGWAGQMVERFPVIGNVVTGAVGAFIAYKGVVMGITAAQWLWNAAMLANPIGLVIAGVGALIGLGVWLYKTFEPVRKLFDAVWEKGKAVAAFFGIGSGTQVGSAMPRARSDAAGSVPALPHVQAAGRGNTTTISAPITVHAAPGMDPKAVADEVDRKLRERESMGRARQRGALHD